MVPTILAGTVAGVTLTSISLRAIAFFATGILLDLKVWIYAMAIVPAGLAGLWAASHLFRRIPRELLMRAMALMLLVSSASLIVQRRAFHEMRELFQAGRSGKGHWLGDRKVDRIRGAEMRSRTPLIRYVR